MEIITGLSIIALAAIVIVQMVLHQKERLEMARIYKAKDLQEVNYLFPEETETNQDVREDEPDLVGMDEIVGALQDK